MHTQISEWFRAAGLEPPRMGYCNSLTVIAHLVEEGVFIGFLPLKLVERAIGQGRMRVLSGQPAPLQARIYAGWRQAEGSPAITAILHASRRVVGEIDFLAPL